MPSSVILFLRLVKTILINITENRRQKVVVAVVLLMAWYIRRVLESRRQHREHLVRQYRKRLLKQKGNAANIYGPDEHGPLITFGGAGMLFFYYQGVAAYLKDNFNLDNCRFAGISAGSCTASGLASGLPVEASLIFGLRWYKKMTEKKFGMYFINSNEFIKVAMKICEEFGVTEEYMQQKQQDNALRILFSFQQ